jgi:hypothetical protein
MDKETEDLVLQQINADFVEEAIPLVLFNEEKKSKLTTVILIIFH